jgi:hypothetical protein
MGVPSPYPMTGCIPAALEDETVPALDGRRGSIAVGSESRTGGTKQVPPLRGAHALGSLSRARKLERFGENIEE